MKSVTIKFPENLIARIDAWGESHGVVKRSDTVRMLLSIALDDQDVAATLQSDNFREAMLHLRCKSPSDAISQLSQWFLESGK